MLNPDDPLVKIKITVLVCGLVATATTLFRIWIRRGRLWWDDGWAGFSLSMLFIQIASVFMHVPDPSLSKRNRIAAYYLMATSFYAIIWSARLAILFSIIRIDPSPNRRKRLLAIGAFFFLLWVVLIAQLFWVCEPEYGWKDMKSPQCTLNKQVATTQLASDIISDALLLAAPLKLLQSLEDKGLRRRLIVIFSTCIVTTIVSLVHASYIIIGGGIKVVVAAIVEDCISLVVCNLPVVVTATLHLRDSNREESTQKIKRRGPSTFLKFATRQHTTRNLKTALSETDITQSSSVLGVSSLTGNISTGEERYRESGPLAGIPLFNIHIKSQSDVSFQEIQVQR